ncbi:hypothetical protein DFH07DRAFT_959168 [Mycena maculata]|uniref:Uncharacterized protein n=1 Tax=Mycena maculata TaxID=230809 RepID=A0AAD7NDT2_9AGAR|nr:hypothetical protein DFH07DRAFT_959168 [Mycena maculata]
MFRHIFVSLNASERITGKSVHLTGTKYSPNSTRLFLTARWTPALDMNTQTSRVYKPSERAIAYKDYPHSDSDDSESNKNAGSTSRKLKRKSSSVQLVSSPITRSRSETSSSARRRRTNTPNEKDETEENFVPEKDDVDEDEDEDELALTPPPKRRKSQVESDDEEVPEVDVTYNISIFKGAGLSKPIKKRQSACNGFIKIANTSSFHAFQKQLFLKVSKLLRTDLDDLTNYEHMVASGLKCKASPSVTIAGENSQSSEEEDTSKKNKSKGKKVKSKIPTENDISPINAGVNQKILELRTRHACHANDGSDYCWVSGEAKEHVALGNPQFQMWGAGWEQGVCDLETPPNHKIFQTKKNAGDLAPLTTLQRRIATANQPTSTAPIINNHFSIPDAFVDMLRPPTVHAPPVPPGPLTLPVISSNTAEDMLLPAGTRVGQQMLIPEFCTLYDLDDSISSKLATNGYKKASAFNFIKLADLTAMEFRSGEIAELRDAIGQWVVPI